MAADSNKSSKAASKSKAGSPKAKASASKASASKAGASKGSASKADSLKAVEKAAQKTVEAAAEKSAGDADEAAGSVKSIPAPSKDMPRKELAEQYQPYVRSIAGKIKKTLAKEIEFDDLVSYGMLGLFEAADRYDAKYGANFMTFAYYRIRGAIYDGLRGMGWVSRTEYQKYRFEQHANQFLNNVHDRDLVPQDGMPAKKTSDDEVNELADVVSGLVTIYVTALDAMEGFQIKDDRGPSVEESLELMQARQLVAEAVGKLPEQERTLLELYYYKELSLEEVGKHLGLSKSWTSRLHTRAIEKLSRLLRDLVGEYEDEMGSKSSPSGGSGGENPGTTSGGKKSTQPRAPPADKASEAPSGPRR